MAILNEAAARRLFPDGDALGRRIGESFEKSGEFEVVGVVRDTKYASVRDPGPPTMYRCVWQSHAAEPARRAQDRGRAAGDVRDGAGRDARGRPDAADSAVHVAERADLAAVRAGAAVRPAYAAFGALAVLLACIGLFGLMSYNVARRTSEIGVRMALGAQRGTVVGMVMGESMRLVAIGVVLGLAAALWAGRFVQTVVYGLPHTIP